MQAYAVRLSAGIAMAFALLLMSPMKVAEAQECKIEPIKLDGSDQTKNISKNLICATGKLDEAFRASGVSRRTWQPSAM
jgi:hypothetical protein